MKGQYRAKENIEDQGHTFFLAGKVYDLDELPDEHKDKVVDTHYFIDESGEGHLVSEKFVEEKFVKTNIKKRL